MFTPRGENIARPFRLLVDARKIADGGIGRYTASLLAALEGEPVQVTALVTAEHRPMLPPYVTPLITHMAPFSVQSFYRLTSHVPWGLFDVYHSPHFFLPRSIPIPTIVTVHDAIPISHPSGILHQRLMSYFLSRLATRANAVITVSRKSALQLRALVGLETRVIPNILPFAAQRSPDVANQSATDSGLPRRYVVGVFSNGKPHKGQRQFAEACAACGVAGVAVGRGGAMLAGHPNITCMADMPWEKLLEVYQGASAVVVASTVEGFCLPAMEGKALGVRIVSTPEPAVCELLDDNDEVASDFSGAALATALRRALARPEREYLWERAAEFYPQRVAKQLMNLYHQALGLEVACEVH